MGEGSVPSCSNHKPIQHRDAKPPWCDRCGRTASGNVPFAFAEDDVETPKQPKQPKHHVVFENSIGNEIVCSCGEWFKTVNVGVYVMNSITATRQWADHYKETLTEE